MIPSGGTRAAMVRAPIPVSHTCLSWAPAPTPSPCPWARPSSGGSYSSSRHVVHTRGSGSCARKGGPRRPRLQEEGGCWVP